MIIPAPVIADPARAADRIAQHLAVPEPLHPEEPWRAQSLAQGAVGTALLHIERAHSGLGTWQQAHTWIKQAAAGEISAADNTGLFLGAPAVAFALHAATAGSSTRYGAALEVLGPQITQLAHRRADAATARIRRGELPAFHEYDVLFGLTGIGAYFLVRDPDGSALERVLRYLVALTQPIRAEGHDLPGWWVAHDPHLRPATASHGGHGNLGAAHGITGPLLLLSKTMRRGITVDGQQEAIATICAWLDAWKQDGAAGPWWPESVTFDDLRTGRTSQPGPARPSWCYGTPGITRAGQLAAIALGDFRLQQAYEDALTTCLNDPAQLRRITDSSLCHGWAGLYLTVFRAARDAATRALSAELPRLADALARRVAQSTAADAGLLEGDAGAALALTAAAQNTPPISGWDACLLID